jgi:glutathionyl-hydroquinone reductase
MPTRNVKRLRDHRTCGATRRMYQHPGIRPTCQLDEIKTHYYWANQP